MQSWLHQARTTIFKPSFVIASTGPEFQGSGVPVASMRCKTYASKTWRASRYRWNETSPVWKSHDKKLPSDGLYSQACMMYHGPVLISAFPAYELQSILRIQDGHRLLHKGSSKAPTTALDMGCMSFGLRNIDRLSHN